MQTKRVSAGFHRLRRAYFKNKLRKRKPNAPIKIKIPDDMSDIKIPNAPIETAPKVEWEPRRGRPAEPVKKYPRPTVEEQMRIERKRIFMDHMKFLLGKKY